MRFSVFLDSTQSYKIVLRKIKSILGPSRENRKPYGSNCANFKLKIMKIPSLIPPPLQENKQKFFLSNKLLYLSQNQPIWSYKLGLMQIKCTLTLSRKESNFYGSKLVQFEFKNHENHPEDIEKWYFLLIHSPSFLESAYMVIYVQNDENKV